MARPKGTKNGTGKPYKREGSRFYYATIYVDGKPKVKSLGTQNYREACRLRDQWERAERENSNREQTKRGNYWRGHLPIAYVWDHFKPFTVSMSKPIRMQYAHNWRIFAEYCGNVGIDSVEMLRQAHILSFLEQVGRNACRSTMEKVVSQLGKIVRSVYDGNNPFANIELGTGAKKQTVMYDTLSDAEVGKLLECARRFDRMRGEDEWELFFTIAAFTGLRKVDVATLRWTSVDTDQAIITLTPAKTKRRSGETVAIPLIDPLLQRLRERKQKKFDESFGTTPEEAILGPAPTSPFVLPMISALYSKTEVAKGSTVGERIDRIFKMAEISKEVHQGDDGNYYKKSFHSFRVRVASKLAKADCPFTIATKILGHSAKMFLHYFRAEADQSRRYMLKAFVPPPPVITG